MPLQLRRGAVCAAHPHPHGRRAADRPGPGDRRRRGAPMTRPRVLIIGCGFGGIEAVRALSKADGRDHARRPHQPPPVPAAALPGGDRRAERAGGQRADPPHAAAADEARQPDDPEGRGAGDRRRRRAASPLDGGERIAYDHLIVAAGATHSYFGHDDWARARAGPEDAGRCVRHPRAASSAPSSAPSARTTPAERDAWLTFVVIGGGPTGVEMAGTMSRDRAAHAARASSAASTRRRAARGAARRRGPRVLGAFVPTLSAARPRAARAARRRGAHRLAR